MRAIFISLLSLIIFLSGCNSNNSNSEKRSQQNEPNEPRISENELKRGFQLLNTTCFSCHATKENLKERVAPPMRSIARHYLSENVSLDQFATDLANFLQDPSEKNARLTHAVDRFGIMPKLQLDSTSIHNMASYIYQAGFEDPDWHKTRYPGELKKYSEEKPDSDPIEIGKRIAMSTKTVLGKNLLLALKEGGPTEAISFCSSRAIPITDSMALELNANIKRVSDRNRNPGNLASAAELEYIEKARKAMANHEAIAPQIRSDGERWIAYYPILTNAMCLQCHGKKGVQIEEATVNKIKEIYPQDHATGYQENELRGIWVIEMDKEPGEM